MKKFLLALIAMTALNSVSYAQKENNVWGIGYHAGLDFNSGSPVPFATSSVSMFSGASVCDESGTLLFYTSGDTVWDKNGHPMPNAYDMIIPYTAIQSLQGALIVPVINNPNRYYVFSHESAGDFFLAGDLAAGRLTYSIVDMSLNGGLGDIVPGKKGIMLDSMLADKMTAVAGNDCNIWVLVHKFDTSFTGAIDTNTNEFEAYEVTDTGLVTTPVISRTGYFTNILAYGGGEMKFSPNRHKLAICSSAGYPEGTGVEICDFNVSTGVVSNAIAIDTGHYDYSIAFSPDNTKLYLSAENLNGDANEIYQYDFNSITLPDLIASKTLIRVTSAIGAYTTSIRLAPDNKIYGVGGDEVFAPPIGNSGGDSVFYINQPNNVGPSCDLVFDAFAFSAGTGAPNTLGNDFVKPLQDTFHTHTDVRMTDSVTLHTPGGYFKYRWNTNSTDSSITVTDTGLYVVHYYNYCIYHTDSFSVHGTAGVKEINAGRADISIYPNPAQDNITVSITNTTNSVNGTIQIIDATGRTVMSQKCSSNKQNINIEHLTNGIYILRYTGTNKTGTTQEEFTISR